MLETGHPDAVIDVEYNLAPAEPVVLVYKTAAVLKKRQALFQKVKEFFDAVPQDDATEEQR